MHLVLHLVFVCPRGHRGSARRHPPRQVIRARGQKILIQLEKMAATRSSLLDAIAAHGALERPCLVRAEVLRDSFGEHHGHFCDKAFDIRNRALIHLCLPHCLVGLALDAKTGLMRSLVFRDRIVQFLAISDSKCHVLGVEL